jgi:hypothetical protein
MAMGMTPEFHGNITRTSREYHDNDTGTWEHHKNVTGVSWQWHWNMGTSCIHLRDNALSLCDFLVAGWSCSLWWVNDQPSSAMPLAETLHKSLEIHPDYMKAAQYLPCIASCLSLYIVHCNCRRFCHSCNVQWKEQKWVHEIVDTTHYVACLFLAHLMGDSGNSQQQDIKSGIL